MPTRIMLALRQWLGGSSRIWLAGLGLVFLIRFPLQFLLQPPFLMDFDLFHTIALRLLQGNAAHLYAPTGSAQSLFKYAPCWALFMAPFGWLSIHAGGVLWSSLTAAWLILTCLVSDRLVRLLGLRPAPYLSIIAVLLLVRPITSEFLLGQTNLLWGLLAAGAVLFDVTHRPWRSAVCLALAISLKLPAAVFLAYFAIRGSWRLVWRAVLCAAAVNGTAALLLSPSRPHLLFSAWLHVLRVSGPDRAFEIGNQSLLALLGRLLRQDGYGLNVLALPDSAVVAVALACGAVLFAALFVPRRQPSDPARTILDGALLTVLMALFSPTCWIATYNGSLFAVFLAVALFLDRPLATLRSAPLAIGAAAIVVSSGLTLAKVWRFLGILRYRGESYVYLVFMIFPLLGLSLAWYLWHQRRLLVRR